MNAKVLPALFLAVGLQAFSQTVTTPQPSLPKDPRAIFAAAAPLYDFTDPSLKPWHLKATCQLYDEHGKPSEQGTFEYWWASPQVHRSTWTRPGATHTEWHTGDGTYSSQSTGEALKYFEKNLPFDLFTPLPSVAEMDPERARLNLDEKSAKGEIYSCVSLAQLSPDRPKNPPPEPTSIYCFDSQLPVLRVTSSLAVITTEFGAIAKVQGKFLAREIVVFVVDRKMFSAKIESVNGLESSDPALTPASGVPLVKDEKEYQTLDPEVAVGRLIKKQTPFYPMIAKSSGQQGNVILAAAIGTDGKIHNLEVVYAPSASLAAAAKDAVSQWEYSPYLVNGKPIEVETTVNVTFTMRF